MLAGCKRRTESVRTWNSKILPIFSHETTALVWDKPPIPVNFTGKWAPVLCAPREGPRWPHYTSRYLKCLHMWTVMLFAAVELLSRPPKALRDLLFLLFSPSSSPLSRSIIIAHMLFQRHPEWNSPTSSMAITCSCWGGRQQGKDILRRMKQGVLGRGYFLCAFFLSILHKEFCATIDVFKT